MDISNKYNQKLWTEQELDSLKKDYLSFISKDIMIKKYNRNWESIRVKANSLGLKRGMPKNSIRFSLPLSKEEIKNMYLNGKDIVYISKICGCSTSNICSILKRENIKTRTTTEISRKYTINENFFDAIDSEQSAYILGFLYADGYNDENGSIHLTLQETDKSILENINKVINSNKPLRFIKKIIGKNHYSLNIENKHISSKLKELGCIRKKSLCLQFPTEEQVPKHLHSHFIRGYFDGDGSIYYSKNNSNCTFSLEGNKDFILSVQEILIKECSLNKTKTYKKHKDRDSSVSLRYCGKNQINKIKNYLYNNATIFLNRKYEVFNYQR